MLTFDKSFVKRGRETAYAPRLILSLFAQPLTAGKCLPLGLCKVTVSGRCKMMEIPNGHVSLKYFVAEATPTYIYTHRSLKGGASQFEAVTHIPLTILLPPGWDCVAVYHAPHGPLARYVKFRVAHAPGMPGTFSPPSTWKETAS